jgi:hypothetical protein
MVKVEPTETKVLSGLVSAHVASSFADQVIKLMPFQAGSDHSSTHFSVCELSRTGKLGQFIREVNDQIITTDFAQYVLECFNERTSSSLRLFPVVSVRIVSETCMVNRLPWHQDEATWYRNHNLRRKNPVTLWIPLRSWGPEPSRLEISQCPASRLVWHKKSATGYFDADEEFYNLNNSGYTLFSSLAIGDVTAFNSLTPHRTTLGSGQFYRLSIDVRIFNPAEISANYEKSWRYNFL